MKKIARKIVAVIAVFALTFCMVGISGYAASANIAVSVSETNCIQDDEITATVYFPKEYKKVAALTMSLVYDSQKLEVVSVTQGKGLRKARDKQSNGEVFSENHSTAGQIKWSLAGGNNYDFTDDFAEIVFKVKSYAEIGESNLNLVVDGAVNSGFVAVDVSVSGASISIAPNIINNLTFKLNDTKDGYLITEYLCMSYDTVVIPSEYNGLPVVGIDYAAFMNHAEIINLTIPSSVKSIGKISFYGCSGIKELNIPVGVTTIDEQAFERCTGLEKLTLPVGLESIAMSAFKGCIRLTDVELPFTLTKLGNGSFSDCYSLNKVKISKNTVIENNSFKSCADDIKFVTVKDNQNLSSYISSSGINPTLEYVKDITLGTLNKIDDQQYTTEAVIPTVDITLMSGEATAVGTDYNIICVDNVDMGTATIYVVGTNGYGEGYKSTFTISCISHPDVSKVISRSPTCTATGRYTVTCNLCGKKYTEVIPANGHTATGDWIIDTRPSITQEGSKHQVCSVCGSKCNITSMAKAYPDLNGDGKINSTDALMVLQYSVGTSSSIETEEQLLNADTNGDGKVNSIDALTILKIAVNMTTI